MGETITSDMIRIIKPCSGIEAKSYDAVVGRRATGNISGMDPIRWDDV